MTFCVGIKVREGIIALADTKIVRGSEHVRKVKLTAIEHADQPLFVMTSGLRSVRDKSITLLSDELQNRAEPLDRTYRFVNLFGEQIRAIRTEDGPALQASGLSFNTHAIIGGCLAKDTSPQLFHMYPAGNWIEVSPDSPYFLIGRTTYGKPILDALLQDTTPLKSAICLALLAFDATRTSVTDVDTPIDLAVVPANTRRATFHRFSHREIDEPIHWWKESLQNSLAAMPMDWANPLLNFTPHTET